MDFSKKYNIRKLLFLVRFVKTSQQICNRVFRLQWIICCFAALYLSREYKNGLRAAGCDTDANPA